MHTNSHLPPVDVPLLIIVQRTTANQMGAERVMDLPNGQCLIKARRTSWIKDRKYDYEVMLDNGHRLTGRWDWVYQ